MDEKTTDMQNEESAEPEDDQHNSQYEKHARPSFLSTGCRAGASHTEDKKRCLKKSLLCL
jgi:hypothetical protein